MHLYMTIRNWVPIALWLGATAIAVFLAMLAIDSAYFEGQYIPLGNDSFYHARRMLDIVAGERGFYQFDERLHVPDGSWIPWPWAYDYILGHAARLALWVRPATDPLGFLSYVPVAWVAVNAALFLAAAGQAGLSLTHRALAMLAFALSPLVQLLHSVGMIDHHFVEFSFVLLVSWLGLRWFAATRDRAAAIGLGLALGLAPGFHNGLFLLQIPVLLSAGLLWLRGEHLPRRDLYALALTLMTTTTVIVLPSEPFRQGMFEFGLLSWFHLYVAACSSFVLFFLGWRSYDKRSLATLGALCLLLSVPLVAQLSRGAAFMSGDILSLSDIGEAKSPYRFFFYDYGPMKTAGYYSWLLLAAPILLVYYLWCASRQSRPGDLFFSVMAVFGLTLLLTQFRFYYFGLFALIVGTLLAVQRLAERWRWKPGFVAVGLLAGLLITYQPSLRERLFTLYPLGASPIYERARPIFLRLADRCEEDPGLILADQDDGNFLLFHTECSVISNNFILRPADERKLLQLGEMMRLSPEGLRQYQPEVKYVLLRARDFSLERDGKTEIVSSSLLAKALLLDSDPPEGFDLIEAVWGVREDGEIELYAKAYAVN
jgi:asparagine N-glycosylation enzyme membrane subunit Stt3